MDLGLSENLVEVREKIRAFVEDKVEPIEAEYLAEIAIDDRWSHTARQEEILNGLKSKNKMKNRYFGLPPPTLLKY